MADCRAAKEKAIEEAVREKTKSIQKLKEKASCERKKVAAVGFEPTPSK